jgi:processive 1,2-diacylglycerol beta-glucosyltransferase
LEPKKKLKVLILSCNTGEGHNAAARAIRERCEAEGHEATVLDFLSLSGNRVSSFISGFYINMAKYVPYVFGFFYNAMLLISRTFYIGHSVVYLLNARVAPKLLAYLNENHYDAVVATHLFPADAIAKLKKQGHRVPLSIMVATDYTCYPFLEEAVCDYYVLAHERFEPVYVKRKIPADKLCPFGIPVSMRFQNPPTREEARAALGIDPDVPMYLVMGGSMGAGRIRSFTKALSKSIGDGKIIVICGKNAKLEASLKARFERTENVSIIGFTTDIPLYMSACDVLYTKPGGLTSTEALVCHTPTIHTAPIPGCESDNMRFFRDHGLAIPAKSIKKQVLAGCELAANADKREEMRQNQMRDAKPNTTLDIVRLIERETEAPACPTDEEEKTI